MYNKEFAAAANAAADKFALLKKNPLGYFLISMLAGAFVGFGVILAFTIGGLLTGLPYARVVMGTSFGVALSLVIMAGSELFTGNTFVMAAGVIRKQARISDTVRLLIVCWLGNLAGSIVLALVYHGTGLASDPVGPFMAAGALAKMSASVGQLFLRGILCNMLVCLAVWCSFRTKSDSAKLIMTFWCIFAFFTGGYEHSVANMTLFTEALLNPCGQAVSLGGAFYNLLFVTLGNITGGIIFLAIPYSIGSREQKKNSLQSFKIPAHSRSAGRPAGNGHLYS